jgi:hypothetical protein
VAACPDDSELSAFVDGQLSSSKIEALHEHLDACPSCFAVIAELLRADASTQPPGEPPSWQHTRQLEEYRLVRPIGRGSGGQVWLADDTLLDRAVAIKFVATGPDARARERFSIEAKAVARLSHPNVVTVHRVGEVDGHPYLVSELVRGRSLDALDLPIPWQRARELGIGLARGLAAAHRAGIIHRDIKPSNAIVGDDGSIKLLDFGLAKLHESPDDTREGSLDDVATASPRLTATGHLLGTPLYMAPEAWQGAAPSFAMDVYSLGALLYELCCGAPPHLGNTMGEVRRAALAGPPRELTERVRDIDPAFARVIKKCLASRPEDRFPSSVELCAELEAPPPPPPRRRAPLVIAAAATIAALAFGVTMAARHRGVRSARSASPQELCSADRWCWDASAIGSFAAVWGARADDIWVVGERGAVRHYDGRTWQNVVVNSGADLYGVHGSSARDVWAVGVWGTVLHYDGSAWRELSARTHSTLFSVWAVAPADAWIVGESGVALHWDGSVWTRVPTPTKESLLRVVGAAANDIWAFGYDACIHWDGHTWTNVDLHTHELVGMVQVISPRDIWAAGFHSVIRHWNGEQWDVEPMPEAASPRPEIREDFPINGGDGTGDETWMIAKRRGLLHRVGTTWTRVDQGTQRELFALKVFARDDAWAVGAANAIVHWDGHAWTSVTPEPVPRSIDGMWGHSADDVWAVGDQVAADRQLHGLAMHFDGHAWTESPLPTGAASLHGISGSDDERWAVGNAGTIVHFGASSWELEPSPVPKQLHGVWADAKGRAWAVGADGTILRRANGAWQLAPSPTSSMLYGIWGTHPGDAWAVGEHTVLRLHGDTWTEVPGVTGETLYAVWGASADDVWAVGEHGTTLHYNGTTWSSVFSDVELPLYAISGAAPNDVWAVSPTDLGLASIIHWNGSQWTAAERTTHAPLSAVWAAGPEEAWAAGYWATFLHHVSGP